MSDENGGGSAGNEPQAPDFSGLLTQVSELIDAKLEPMQSVVSESKNKSQRRNEELAAQLKAEREKRESLEGKLKEAGLADGGSVDQGLQLLKSQHEMLRKDYDGMLSTLQEQASEIKTYKSELRRKELEDLVLGDVAPDAREDGLLLMEGYLKNKGIDLDETQDLGALANSMRDRFLPRLSVQNADERRPAASREQPGAPVDPSKVNWDDYEKWTDVPAHLKSHVPPDVFERMETARFGGSSGGMHGLGV